MGTLSICPWTRTKAAPRTRAAEVPVEAPARQSREESPFLNANAADALVLAASPIAEDRLGRHVVAVVMDDGTVVSSGAESGRGERWANGKVAGRDWTLWWERRAL